MARVADWCSGLQGWGIEREREREDSKTRADYASTIREQH